MKNLNWLRILIPILLLGSKDCIGQSNMREFMLAIGKNGYCPIEEALKTKKMGGLITRWEQLLKNPIGVFEKSGDQGCSTIFKAFVRPMPSIFIQFEGTDFTAGTLNSFSFDHPEEDIVACDTLPFITDQKNNLIYTFEPIYCQRIGRHLEKGEAFKPLRRLFVFDFEGNAIAKAEFFWTYSRLKAPNLDGKLEKFKHVERSWIILSFAKSDGIQEWHKKIDGPRFFDPVAFEQLKIDNFLQFGHSWISKRDAFKGDWIMGTSFCYSAWPYVMGKLCQRKP